MKKVLFFSLVAMLLGVSCAPKTNDVEEPTLSLSQRELSFGNAEATESITVQTNQSGWVAVCPKEGEWVELRQNGNTLEVKVKPNTLGVERKTFLTVNAHGMVEKVSITQSAADVVLEAMPETILISQQGGKTTLDINSNTESWTAELEQEVDWLAIKASPRRGIISLQAEPNTSTNARTVKLIAKSGSKIVEIPITQNGKEKYLFPIFLKDIPNFDAILRAEVARGSILTEYKDVSAQNPKGYAEFTTASAVFSKIIYTWEINASKKLQYAAVGVFAYGFEEANSDEFLGFMTEQGYEPISKNETVAAYLNEDLKMNLMMIKTSEKEVQFIFTPRLQTKAYPTFPTFPSVPYIEFLEVKKVKDVKAYETNEGSTLLEEATDDTYPEQTQSLFYETAPKNHLLNRAYLFYTASDQVAAEQVGAARASLGIWDTTDLVMFKHEGKWYVTDEFKAMLLNEGFVLLGDIGDGYVYHRLRDHLTMNFRAMADPDFNGGRPFVNINFFHQNLDGYARQNLLPEQLSNADVVKKDMLKAKQRIKELDAFCLAHFVK